MLKQILIYTSIIFVYTSSSSSQERVHLTRFCTTISDLYQVIKAEQNDRKMEYLTLTTSGSCRDTTMPKAPAYAAHYVGMFYMYSGRQVFEIGVFTDRFDNSIAMLTWAPVETKGSKAAVQDGTSKTYKQTVAIVNNLLGR